MPDMEDAFHLELYRINKTYCPAFKGFAGGISPDDDDPRIVSFFRNHYQSVSYEHPEVFDRYHFISKCLSNSYAPKEGEAHYDAYVSAVSDLFDRFAKGGSVTAHNRVVAYIGTV